mgnify:CR=1 FL=1
MNNDQEIREIEKEIEKEFEALLREFDLSEEDLLDADARVINIIASPEGYNKKDIRVKV